MSTLYRGLKKGTTKGSSGNKDYTDANFGSANPKGYLIDGGKSGRNASSVGLLSCYAIGDGSVEAVVSTRVHNSTANTDCNTRYRGRSVLFMYDAGDGMPEVGKFGSFITDGVRLDYDDSKSSENLNLLFLGGSAIANLEVQEIVQADLTTGSRTLSPFGFTPDILIILGGYTLDYASLIDPSTISRGYVINNASGTKERAISFMLNDGLSTTDDQYLGLYNDYGYVDIDTAGNLETYINFSNFGVSGDFDVTVGGNNKDGDLVVMGIQLASDHKADIFDIETPASTGNVSYAVSGVKPRVLIGAIADIESWDTIASNNDSGAFSFFSHVENGGSTYGGNVGNVSEEGVTTTDTLVICQDDVIRQYNDTGTLEASGTPSLGLDNKVDINWGTIGGDTGNLGFGLVIGEEVSSRKPDFMPYFF